MAANMCCSVWKRYRVILFLMLRSTCLAIHCIYVYTLYELNVWTERLIKKHPKGQEWYCIVRIGMEQETSWKQTGIVHLSMMQHEIIMYDYYRNTQKLVITEVGSRVTGKIHGCWLRLTFLFFFFSIVKTFYRINLHLVFAHTLVLEPEAP